MALGKRCSSMKARMVVVVGGSGALVDGEEQGSEFVKYTRSYSFGRRKRVLITSNHEDLLSLESTFKTPSKRICSIEPEKSHLECLPQEEQGLEFVKYTRSYSFGRRKRVLITSNHEDLLSLESTFKTPSKRICSIEPEKSHLECLPQDLLIRILCGVDHDDLNQLSHVSKVIREATVIAKQCHFAYSTPRKTRAFQTPIDFEEPSELDEIEAPNAPKQRRSYKSRLNQKSIADLSVALFASPRKSLFMETEF